MTITSVGYAGSVGDVQWAGLAPRMGRLVSVDDYASFRVTATTGVRTVAIAPGGATAAGIFDVSDAVETRALPSVPSGTRWDLVALRRTWGTRASTLVVIPGGSAPVLPPAPARKLTPGVEYDQPLALVLLTAGAGANSIQEIIDLRCLVNNGGALAWHNLVRSYVDQVGTQLRIGNTLWSRSIDANGSPVWLYTDVTPDTGWVEVGKNGGWSWNFGQARRIGSQISVRLSAARQVGWSPGNQLAILAAPFRPDAAWYANSSANSGKTEFMFGADGNVTASQLSNGAWGVTIHTTYPAARPTEGG